MLIVRLVMCDAVPINNATFYALNATLNALGEAYCDG